MAAKGPNSSFGGFNVKSGKSSEDLFNDLMQSIASAEEESEYISSEDAQQLNQSSQEEQPKFNENDVQSVDTLEQMIQKITAPQEPVYVQVTPPVVEPPKVENAVPNKKFNIDPTKPFNQQQPRKGTNQRKITEEPLQVQTPTINLEKEPEQTELPPEEETRQESVSRLDKYNQPQEYDDDNQEEIQEEIRENSRGNKKGNKSKASKGKNTAPQGKSGKGKQSYSAEEAENRKLTKKGFPKKYYDPTDAETDPNTGETDYFFNIEKTLRKNNLLWITKIIPLDFLDRLTYDKKPLDDYARKQHAKTVQLNNSSAKEQYQYETRNKIIKFLSGVGITAACVLYVLFSVIPNNNYEKALDLYMQEDWDNAQTAFTEMGNYKNSKFYGKYSEAMTKLIAKDYDAAKADFSLLLDYQELFPVSIQDAVYNCDYQKAIKTYSEGRFEDAMKIFATIAEFQESKIYYYKCGYEIADDYFEAGELEKALDAFYKVRAYEDSGTRLSEIANQIYDTAMANYNISNYEEALVDFTFLSKYNFKESKSMINQCQYRAGLNRYAAGEYEEARQLFSKVLAYKDSNAMYKECTYRIAKLSYASSIEGALKEYSEISQYRDVPTILKQGVFTIFGEWQITEKEGQKTNPVNFKFNQGGLFQTNKNVLYTAISTEATPIAYKWNGEKYVTADGKYSLSAQAIDKNTMLLTCSTVANEGGQEAVKRVTFTCVRKANYLTMLANNNVSDNEQGNQQGGNIHTPSKDQTITSILQTYVDKKTDGTVIIGDKEINCLLIVQQINDKLGQN